MTDYCTVVAVYLFGTVTIVWDFMGTGAIGRGISSIKLDLGFSSYPPDGMPRNPAADLSTLGLLSSIKRD